ncbi:MAG TPA: DUF2017 family protein [Acidimicrobiales bacterium]|nr:DUF2017 family protein [Acidimicrobiales bacterium]
MLERRVKRRRDGRYALKLDADERELLRSLPDQLLELLDTNDPVLTRLYPPAYAGADDVALEAEYRRLMGSDLEDRHKAALVTLRDTIDAPFLTEEQMGAWLAAINELRLVLGTRLDVGEEDSGEVDPTDPRAPTLALYQYLSFLQDQLVEAATGAL